MPPPLEHRPYCTVPHRVISLCTALIAILSVLSVLFVPLSLRRSLYTTILVPPCLRRPSCTAAWDCAAALRLCFPHCAVIMGCACVFAMAVAVLLQLPGAY